MTVRGSEDGEDWRAWQWDESLFEGTARYYRQGRPPYSPSLADAIEAAVPLDGRGRLLDVGCGPGVIALQLAHLFEEVVGLDPDAGMIDEAHRAAAERRITNATWVRCRAEDLPAGLGTFRVITFAQSLHWMDRPAVAAAARTMVEPAGAVVQIDPRSHTSPPPDPNAGPHPAIPKVAIDELRVQYLGPDRRAGRGVRNTSPSGEDEIFQAAGFLPEERIPVRDVRILERTTDDVVAWVFTASFAAPHLFGHRLADFEVDLRQLLQPASPEGVFSVPLSDNEIRVRRPRA